MLLFLVIYYSEYPLVIELVKLGSKTLMVRSSVWVSIILIILVIVESRLLINCQKTEFYSSFIIIVL